MDGVEDLSNSEPGSNIEDMFKDFMARVTKFEEGAAVGSKLLSGFQQGLEVHLCQMGLKDHLNKAASIRDDLESLLEDVNTVIQTRNEILVSSDENIGDDFNGQETDDEVEMRSSPERADINIYASLMSFIYCNIKQDYLMQEKIVNALKLSSTSGELESYCLMWSLHPFIDDEAMQIAWSLIP